MKCSLLTLSTYLDGELDPQRRSEVDAHIVGCRRCETGLAHLANESGRVADLARVHVPDESVADLLNRLGILGAGEPLPELSEHARLAGAAVRARAWAGASVGTGLPWRKNEAPALPPPPTWLPPPPPAPDQGERAAVTAPASSAPGADDPGEASMPGPDSDIDTNALTGTDAAAASDDSADERDSTDLKGSRRLGADSSPPPPLLRPINSGLRPSLATPSPWTSAAAFAGIGADAPPAGDSGATPVADSQATPAVDSSAPSDAPASRSDQPRSSAGSADKPTTAWYPPAPSSLARPLSPSSPIAAGVSAIRHVVDPVTPTMPSATGSPLAEEAEVIPTSKSAPPSDEFDLADEFDSDSLSAGFASDGFAADDLTGDGFAAAPPRRAPRSGGIVEKLRQRVALQRTLHSSRSAYDDAVEIVSGHGAPPLTGSARSHRRSAVPKEQPTLPFDDDVDTDVRGSAQTDWRGSATPAPAAEAPVAPPPVQPPPPPIDRRPDVMPAADIAPPVAADAPATPGASTPAALPPASRRDPGVARHSGRRGPDPFLPPISAILNPSPAPALPPLPITPEPEPPTAPRSRIVWPYVPDEAAAYQPPAESRDVAAPSPTPPATPASGFAAAAGFADVTHPNAFPRPAVDVPVDAAPLGPADAPSYTEWADGLDEDDLDDPIPPGAVFRHGAGSPAEPRPVSRILAPTMALNSDNAPIAHFPSDAVRTRGDLSRRMPGTSATGSNARPRHGGILAVLFGIVGVVVLLVGRGVSGVKSGVLASAATLSWAASQAVIGTGRLAAALHMDRRALAAATVGVVLLGAGVATGKHVVTTTPSTPVSAVPPVKPPVAGKSTTANPPAKPVATPAAAKPPQAHTLSNVITIGRGTTGVTLYRIRFANHAGSFRIVMDLSGSTSPTVVLGFENPTTLDVVMSGTVNQNDLGSLPDAKTVTSVRFVTAAKPGETIVQLTLAHPVAVQTQSLGFLTSPLRLVIDLK